MNGNCLKKAVRISLPMAFEHGVLSGAQIISTKIVSPLGTVSVAANSLAVTAFLMFFFAPGMFSMLTPDAAVQELGVRVLRIEAFAEPLYACSIVAAGALRGAGDTLVPSVMNLMSMWGIRITMAAFLAPRIGLTGVWIAMCVELCIRGILFLIRLFREKWLGIADS